MITVIWTDYLKYKADLRGFDLPSIEKIVRFSDERYLDTATQRMVVVGWYGNRLVMIPYEQEADTMTPVTIHSTTRQQINFRLQTGRLIP